MVLPRRLRRASKNAEESLRPARGRSTFKPPSSAPCRLSLCERYTMRTVLPSLVAAAVLAVGASAAEPQPPKGFTALFNGTDLAGWHGMPHYDPYKLDALAPEERAAKIAE